MESYFIWGITGLILLAIFIPYVIKFRRQNRQNQERKLEAQALGIDRPTSQFPFIDQSLCIGCASCILACPEGDVLGLIFGKATVINGLRCVGHGRCEPACPVGAVKVGLGDIQKRADIPVLDEFHQTSVAGAFIAGELGGLALIRNAIEQGTRVAERISQTCQPGTDPDLLDIIIVGAGPAGLSTALIAKQRGLTFRILDQQDLGGTILQYPRQKLVMTQPVEIPGFGRLTKNEYSKEELMAIWTEVIQRNQIQVDNSVRVDSVQKINQIFWVETTIGSLQSKNVVLAMGRRGTPRKLEVAGEELSKVAYQLIDAQSYQHKNILVVGGGDSAVESAIALARQEGNRVYISYRKEKFFRIKRKNEERVNEMIQQKRILPLFHSQVQEIRSESVIVEISGKFTEIPNDHIFILIGGIPPFQMLRDLGVTFGGETKNAIVSTAPQNKPY